MTILRSPIPPKLQKAIAEELAALDPTGLTEQEATFIAIERVFGRPNPPYDPANCADIIARAFVLEERRSRTGGIRDR